MLEATLQVDPDSEPPVRSCMLLEKAFNDCEVRLRRPATNLDVCDELSISLRELYALLDRIRGLGLGCVDEFVPVDTDVNEGPFVKYTPDTEQRECYRVYSRSKFRVALVQAIDALPKNEKLVVSLFHNEELTITEIARIFGISEMRVSQIHTTAMLRIRGKMMFLGGQPRV